MLEAKILFIIKVLNYEVREEIMHKRYTLKNGIKVVTEYIPYVNSISIGVWIGSGSRYENEHNNGVSHFIEHMLFKGTYNRSAKQLASEIEELGGQINAFTGKEATCFYVKLLDQHYETGIDVLSDMLINPRLSEEDIEKEKSVIQEEIYMYEDSPEELVADLLSYATWKNDTLAYPILGTEQTIKNMNKDIIMDYILKTYNPHNIVISVAGNFDEDKLIYKLEDFFGNLTRKSNFNPMISSPVPNKEILVKNKDIEQVHICLTLKGIELGNDRLYTLLAVNNYFGGGTSSQLFQKLREEKGYVYTIYSYPSSYKNAGIYNIYFALNENYIENAMELVHNEIQNILLKKIDDDKIKKAKEQLKGSYILGLESVSSRMFSMGKSEIMLKKISEPKEILDKIDSITKEDVYETIDYVFSEGIISAAAVGRNVNQEDFKKIVWR